MKKKKKKKKRKDYWEMTTKELGEATKEYDKPIPLSRTRPLSPKERSQFEKWRHGPHFSVYITKGDDGVHARIPADILKRSCRYAHERGMTMSEVISRSLKGLLAIVD